MDERDWRVRANLYLTNKGVATGLFNHVKGLENDAVDINPGQPNAEPKFVRLENHWEVFYDLCFPPDKQDIAQGLYNHTKNVKSNKSPDPMIVCGGSIERCGHRLGIRCDTIGKYIVE